MAEERLFDIDTDKDKKYKIRINENGEEELVIEGFDESSAENAESVENVEEISEEDVYDVPEIEEDDEDAALLTPEQYAAKMELARQKAEEEAEKFSIYLGRAKECYSSGDFTGAVENIAVAEEANAEDGELCMIKFLALTKNLTDFSQEDECLEGAENVEINCSDEQKERICSLSAPLDSAIIDLHREVEALRLENEEKRASRRTIFLEKRKSALKWFLSTAIPFVVFLCLFIGFFTVRYAMQNGTYLIITIVFGALAGVAFIAALLTGRKLWAAVRKVSLNEKDTSTQLGRTYIEKNDHLELLKAIRATFKQDL